jgi:hypothetical protein
MAIDCMEGYGNGIVGYGNTMVGYGIV